MINFNFNVCHMINVMSVMYVHLSDGVRDDVDSHSDYILLPFLPNPFASREEVVMPSPLPPPPPPPLPPRREPLPPRAIPKPHLRPPHHTHSVELGRKTPTLFLSLASAALKCLSVGLAGVSTPLLGKKLLPEHVSCLAWLVLNVDSTQQSIVKEPKSKLATSLGDSLVLFGTSLMTVIQEMIMSGAINHDYLQGVLLHELGLHTKCWPLSISPMTLSLLGQVLVCRLQKQAAERGTEDGQDKLPAQNDDSLAVSIWKG